MKIRTFLQFAAPSVVLMILLLAVPLLSSFYLSVRNCAFQMETVRIEESTPFGKRETVTQRAKLDANGRALEVCEFVGLDYYRKGGDSLIGRFHYHRLHPLSLPEADCSVDDLLRFGGFPEPFLKGQERFHRRWLREVSARILHEDRRDLERVREVTQLELLLHHLPSCVGSPLSVNSLGKLLQVAHASIERWLTMFERLYLVYRIEPFGSRRIRAVRKEKKLYFWDWSRVQERGTRFENLVASHLLKYCHAVEDTQGHAMELRFIRDTDKREVDFVVLRDGRPEFAVECKSGDRQPAPACRYFRERTTIPEFYQVHLGTRDYGDQRSGTRVLPFAQFCKERGLP